MADCVFFSLLFYFYILLQGWERKVEKLDKNQQPWPVWPCRLDGSMACDVYTCAVGNGLEPLRSICQMITCSHLQSVLEADQRSEPILQVIQAFSLGLNSIFFTSHRIRIFCCSTVAQQWHPGAILFAVEISLLISQSICTWANPPWNHLERSPSMSTSFWSICFTLCFLTVNKKEKENGKKKKKRRKRAFVPNYLGYYLFGLVI